MENGSHDTESPYEKDKPSNCKDIQSNGTSRVLVWYYIDMIYLK